MDIDRQGENKKTVTMLKQGTKSETSLTNLEAGKRPTSHLNMTGWYEQ